jgi:hypothetical protein
MRDDGFKTFEGFGLDLGPMQDLGSMFGKSNLFDAIRLLSNLAGSDCVLVRGLRGEGAELFRIRDGSRSTRMMFAIELLLAPEVRDPWGS